MSAAVTARSAMTTPMSPRPAPTTNAEPEDDRRGRPQDRQEAELRRPLLHPQHVEREERESNHERVQEDQPQRNRGRAVVERTRASHGDAPRLAASRTPFTARRKKKMVLASRCRARFIVALVEEAHERSVQAAAEEDLRDDLDRTEQAEDAVVAFAQVSDVNRQQQQVDGGNRHVSCAVDGQLLPEVADFGKASGLPERQQVQEAPAGNGEQTGEKPVHGQQRPGVPPDESCHYRDGRKDALPADQIEPGSLSEADVFPGRPIARDACAPRPCGSGVRPKGNAAAIAGARGWAPTPAARRRASTRGGARRARAADRRTSDVRGRRGTSHDRRRRQRKEAR